MSTLAALLDESGKVIGEVYDAPATGYSIGVAASFTDEGNPVNVRTYKISRSKVNLSKAEYTQPASKKGNVWTFEYVADEG